MNFANWQLHIDTISFTASSIDNQTQHHQPQGISRPSTALSPKLLNFSVRLGTDFIGCFCLKNDDVHSSALRSLAPKGFDGT